MPQSPLSYVSRSLPRLIGLLSPQVDDRPNDEVGSYEGIYRSFCCVCVCYSIKKEGRMIMGEEGKGRGAGKGRKVIV